MFEMYQNYADYKHWTFDIVNYTPAEIGTVVLWAFHQDDEIKSSVSVLYLSHIICLCRWVASCCCSYFRRWCLQASEIWRRDSSSPEDPWDGPIIKNAAYSHWDNVSYCPPSARGGKLTNLGGKAVYPCSPILALEYVLFKTMLLLLFGDFTDTQVLCASPSKWTTSSLSLEGDSPWLCTLHV